MSEAVKSGWAPPTLAQSRAPVSPAAPAVEAEDARRSGYDAGYAEGLAAGRAQGESIAGEMSALLQAMAVPFRESEATMLRELLDLVEKAVAAVLDRELQSGDYDLEKLLRESLEVLGSVNRSVELTLNPVDAALTRDLGITADVSIVEDARVPARWSQVARRTSPGGCQRCRSPARGACRAARRCRCARSAGIRHHP